MSSLLAMFGLPGGMEWILIGLAALLLFGRRLPDVARSLGQSIVEFKKGLSDVKDQIDKSGSGSKSGDQSRSDKSSRAGERSLPGPESTSEKVGSSTSAGSDDDYHAEESKSSE
jgi:sec-independent protein translocase protein TatA